MRKPRTAKIVAGIVIAVIASIGSAGPASAGVGDSPFDLNPKIWTSNGHRAYVYAVTNGAHKAAYAYILGTSGTVQARAQCQRGDGRTSWYESTINAGPGSSSHYDCDNNGTYDRAVVGLGVDLH